MAEFAPMPTANVTMAAAARPRERRRTRAAYRTSCQTLSRLPGRQLVKAGTRAGLLRNIRRCGGDELVDEVLELLVQEIRAELVLLHLGEGLRWLPAVDGHPVDRRHHARAVTTAHAVDV